MTAAEGNTWRWDVNYKLPEGILVNTEDSENINVPEEAMIEIRKMLESKEHWSKIVEFINGYNQKHS